MRSVIFLASVALLDAAKIDYSEAVPAAIIMFLIYFVMDIAELLK